MLRFARLAFILISFPLLGSFIKQKLPERDKGFEALKTGQQDPKYYEELVTGHAVDLARAQV